MRQYDLSHFQAEYHDDSSSYEQFYTMMILHHMRPQIEKFYYFSFINGYFNEILCETKSDFFLVHLTNE